MAPCKILLFLMPNLKSFNEKIVLTRAVNFGMNDNIAFYAHISKPVVEMMNYTWFYDADMHLGTFKPFGIS